MIGIRFCLIPLVLALAAPVAAETVFFKDQPKLEPPMRIVVVRDADPECEPDCAEWIAAQGRVTADTPAALRRAIKELGGRKSTIVLKSGGGDLKAAMAMGAMIRAAKLNTAIGISDIVPPEAAKRPRAIFHSIGAYCYSACPFIFSAGAQRYLDDYALAGVHQMTIRRKSQSFMVMKRQTIFGPVEVSRKLMAEYELPPVAEDKLTDPENRVSAKYFSSMGIDASIMPLVVSAPPDSAHRLTHDELISTRLATDAAEAVISSNSGHPINMSAKSTADVKALFELMSKPRPVAAATSPPPAPVLGLTGRYPLVPAAAAPPTTPALGQIGRYPIELVDLAGVKYSAYLFVAEVPNPLNRGPSLSLGLRLLRDGHLAETKELALLLTLPNGTSIAMVNSAPLAPMGPMVGLISKEVFCAQPSDASIKLRLVPAVAARMFGVSSLTNAQALPESQELKLSTLDAVSPDFCAVDPVNPPKPS